MTWMASLSSSRGSDAGDADTLHVRWRYTNTTTEDRVLAGGTAEPQVRFLLTGGAYLVDQAHQKKHLVVTDQDDLPVASEHGGPDWIIIAPEETIEAWAKFPAPPEDVEVISVHIPGLPPFDDIPITRERS